MSRLTRSELNDGLDRRIAEPESSAKHDQAIWDQCGAHRSIFVLDLSGFTRTTRELGILHFLTVFRRAARIVSECIEASHGRVVKSEADNVIACFEKASEGLAAARLSMQRVAEMNASLAERDRAHLCVAVGSGWILELEDDFFGAEVNVTFKLGEDVARAGELLLTQGAWDELQQLPDPPTVEPFEVTIGGVVTNAFRVQ